MVTVINHSTVVVTRMMNQENENGAKVWTKRTWRTFLSKNNTTWHYWKQWQSEGAEIFVISCCWLMKEVLHALCKIQLAHTTTDNQRIGLVIVLLKDVHYYKIHLQVEESSNISSTTNIFEILVPWQLNHNRYT